MVVFKSVHASGHSLLLDPSLLLLPALVLDGAVARRVRLTVAKGAENGCAVTKQLLRAVLELVAWLPAALTPNAP